MKRSAKASRSILLLLVAAGAAVLSAQQPAKPKPIWARNHPLPHGFNVGEAFPTDALPSAVDGKPMSIADFRGKKVIVNIFASW